MRAEAAAATKALLAKLWEKNLPVLRERLHQLETAAEAAHAGTLTPEQRREAAGTAHKLAGSLGMFGYPQGTELARVLEREFEAGLERSELTAHVALLRSSVGL